MKIEYLADNMNFAEDVAKMIYNEFIKDIRQGISYEQVQKAVKDSNKTELPIRLAAIEDNKCAGTIALVENDLKNSTFTPWLAALYVEKEYRGKKIAEQLINKIINITKALGYNEIYLRTEHTSEYYRKRGWQFVETCTDEEFNLKTDVFKSTII